MLASVIPVDLYGLLCERDKDLKTFTQFFQFVYTGVVDLDMNIVETTLEFSDKFGVYELTKSCGKFLKDALAVTTVCWILEIAHR